MDIRKRIVTKMCWWMSCCVPLNMRSEHQLPCVRTASQLQEIQYTSQSKNSTPPGSFTAGAGPADPSSHHARGGVTPWTFSFMRLGLTLNLPPSSNNRAKMGFFVAFKPLLCTWSWVKEHQSPGGQMISRVAVVVKLLYKSETWCPCSNCKDYQTIREIRSLNPPGRCWDWKNIINGPLYGYTY